MAKEAERWMSLTLWGHDISLDRQECCSVSFNHPILSCGPHAMCAVCTNAPSPHMAHFVGNLKFDTLKLQFCCCLSSFGSHFVVFVSVLCVGFMAAPSITFSEYLPGERHARWSTMAPGVIFYFLGAIIIS